MPNRKSQQSHLHPGIRAPVVFFVITIVCVVFLITIEFTLNPKPEARTFISHASLVRVCESKPETLN